MGPEAFQRTEDEYFRLRGLFDAGRITRDEFEARLKELVVQDAEGRYWMMGLESGKWYVHDGQAWVEGLLPGMPAPPAPPVLPPPIAIAPAAGRRVPLVPALIALAVLVVVGLAALLLLRPGMLLSGSTVTIVWTATPMPGASSTTVAAAAVTLTADSQAASPTLRLPPTATLIPPATTPLPPTSTPTLAPPTATLVATNTLVLPTATKVPATRVPVLLPTAVPLPTQTPTTAASPTLAIPPGVYVTGLRSNPAQPLNLQDITFYPTFVNTTGGEAHYRWCVEIWDPENSKNSFGVTSCRDTFTIPAGTNELATWDTYRVVRGGSCLPLRARVISIDAGQNRTQFSQPDGSTFWYSFQVCPVT